MNAEIKTTHTPGPWEVEHDDDSDEDFNHWEWPYRIHNPELPAREDDSVHKTYTVCEFQDLISEADAALIAAAPDMYQALLAAQQCIQDMIDVYENGAGRTVLDQAVHSLKYDARKAVNTAIAKATTPTPQ